MARMNRNIAVWLINLLDIKPNDTVLEIGFGPGIAIGQMADLGLGRQICGIDYSPEMLQQATARNMEAIKSGRVDLRFGSVEHLPFRDNTFDKVFAHQLDAGLARHSSKSARGVACHEIRPGRIVLGFTPKTRKATA